MAVSLVKELRLRDAGLIGLYEEELALWPAMLVRLTHMPGDTSRRRAQQFARTTLCRRFDPYLR